MDSPKAPKTYASLVRISSDRRSSIERARFQLAPKQIQSILLNHFQNDEVKEYSDLLVKLRTFDISDDNFVVLFEDCCSCVCLLGQNASDLVNCLCQIAWVNRPVEVIQLYERFILSLVTAQMNHTPTVFTAVLGIFKKDVKMWKSEPSEDLTRIWDVCHSLLSRILEEIPLSKDILIKCILEQYPYHKAGAVANRAYLYNLLIMTKYFPRNAEQILAVIINRLAVMDVSVDAKQTNCNKNDACLFSMEIENVELEMFDTIDFCMMELLQWLDKEKTTAVNTVFSVFESVLLPTFGTRYVQFLVFYAISINQNCADRTLAMLWSVAAGHHTYGVSAISLRCTAIFHLSGLIARARHIPKARMTHYLKLMTDWCHNYITAVQDCSTTPADSAKAHLAFYAISEAVFYLIAFKHQQLFGHRKALNFVESLNLPRLVTCALNPLRFCSPHVSRAFAAVTRSYQIVYCHALLERNTRHNFVSSVSIQHNQWFPYDPFTLSRSGKWIWPLYAEYEEWSDTREMDITEPLTKLKDVDEDDFLATSPTINMSSSFSKYVLPGFKHDI